MSEANGKSTEPLSDPRMKVYKRHINRDFFLAVVTVVTVLGGFAVWLMKAAEAKAAAGVEKALAVEADLAVHKISEEQHHTEVQNDVRGVYKYLLTRQRQPRLELPAEPP